MKRSARALLRVIVLLGALVPAAADEGLWLFNEFPKDLVRQRYGFAVTDAWLDHFRLSCVNMGGSASFVSADGLIVTNHHVGAGAIHALSTAERDLMKHGFLARTRAEELRCPGLEVKVLQAIEDVTARVLAAEKPGMDAVEAGRARSTVISALEKEASASSGLSCRVVTLYAGGIFHLYKYRTFGDVRLVFAPEQPITFFGGDPDNYGYPRYCLDVAFFRIYEDGKPYRTPHHLKWNTSGLREGELVFAAGNPQATSRLLTMSQLEFLRDASYPFIIDNYVGQRDRFTEFGKTGDEETRVAGRNLWGALNEIKCFRGQMTGLTDAALMKSKGEQEAATRAAVERDPALRALVDGAWDEIAEARREYAGFYEAHELFANGLGFDTAYFRIARALVRAASGEANPDGEALLRRLYARPIDPGFEKAKLAESLTRLSAECAGLVETRWILGGASPEEAAAKLLAGTALGDPKAARALLEGGRQALGLSGDTMVKLALLVDPLSLALESRFEDRVRAVEVRNGGLIARAVFALRGTSIPPDATSTLRISFGKVAGYVEDDGTKVPYETDYRGLYRRSDAHGNAFPFDLPPSFLAARSRVRPNAPLNFVATCDSSGGNSGSPLVNRKGEFIGILFDGNRQSLPARFLYTDRQARSVMVHAGGILEALRSVYDARELVAELLGRS